MKHAYLILPLISVLFLTFASCSKKYQTATGEIWATSYHIIYSGRTNLDDSIICQMKIIDMKLSSFNPESEVSAINSGDIDIVGNAFRDVFETSKTVNKLSGGVYDPTIGPLTDIWGFGRDDRPEVSDSLINNALESVGIDECYIIGDRIVKKHPSTRFDFSSIAKGYGIDCIADMFERNGVDNFMIEIGGEVAVRGYNPSGRPWHIQVDSPQGGMAHQVLTIKAIGPERTAIASSGNYRNFKYSKDGTTYGHTLSPKTGHPVTSTITAATVISTSCAYADALATACMASGCADSATAIVKRANVKALLIDSNKGLIDINFGL